MSTWLNRHIATLLPDNGDIEMPEKANENKNKRKKKGKQRMYLI